MAHMAMAIFLPYIHKLRPTEGIQENPPKDSSEFSSHPVMAGSLLIEMVKIH